MKSEMIHIVTPEVIDQQNLVLMSFSREEVESGDFFRFDESAFHLGEAGKKARGILLPSFAYDADPRELYEIPEVVAYVSEMVRKVPHLFYYVTPDVEPVRPLYLCLIGVFVVSRSLGKAQLGVRDIEAARRTTQRLIENASAYARSVEDIMGGVRISSVLRSFGLS